ncbi:MAG TPA: hypothetical protein VN668_05465 [Stellaceae bacterium]|nr:hypothetical protein [Stellaceae bacterium]
MSTDGDEASADLVVGGGERPVDLTFWLESVHRGFRCGASIRQAGQFIADDQPIPPISSVSRDTCVATARQDGAADRHWLP